MAFNSSQLSDSARNPNELIDVGKHVALERLIFRPKIDLRARNVRKTERADLGLSKSEYKK
jgi:hypothetical protein